ncbi:MAG TPA: hypothetical protein DEF34_09490 [Desulfotomaculum sp.]|nr:MAG: hypothetical protein VR67_09480 [Peptococcaceae bacterium BRH_c8a]KJS75291.1 MAG: hypothetical protein JL56_08740 [Desulfotomaculum sp. BICA1-6]HBX23845.1 hypothetical protein [Desulfotomaculum sp.]
MVQNKFSPPDSGITPVAASRFNLRQVENILYEHTGVDEVAVLCIADDESENKNIVAFIVPREPGMTEEAIFKYLEQSGLLQTEQLPGEVKFVSRIPKSPSGKVLKMKLLEGCVRRN